MSRGRYRLPQQWRLATQLGTLSPAARRRLKWMDYYRTHGENARLTCRHFDISPQTFYRWWRRYNPQDLTTLEGQSRAPRRRRQPTWSPALAAAVRVLRQQYPRWGKDKLVILLHRAGWTVSHLAAQLPQIPPRAMRFCLVQAVRDGKRLTFRAVEGESGQDNLIWDLADEMKPMIGAKPGLC